MSKINLEDLFKNLENDFDIETPNTGHEKRFLNKIKQDKKIIKITRSKTNLWKPLIGVAASIALLVSLFIFSSKNNSTTELVNIPLKVSKTETLFMAAFSKELENLDSEDMPEYQELIVDALFEIKVLEEDYNQLIVGLKERPDDELILSAIILNFQSRIDVIQNTKESIEDLKQSNKQISII